MKCFSTKNLTTQTMVPCVPWEFVPDPSQIPGERIRHDKESRQQWYHSLDTQWQFYTLDEGTNPGQRISADNPPKFTYGAVVDIDLSILEEHLEAQVKKLPFPPTYIERSLGTNWRLLFQFEIPIRTDTMDFAVFVKQHLSAWLKLKLFPGVDEKAFLDPTRLYCTGTDWKKTGYGPIPENRVQAFLVNVAEKFRFKNVSDYEIPLDKVEKLLLEKYPKMTWPEEFVVDSQGPTFWVPESTSPKSAIVKVGGMFTFSAHATKNFYSWADLLGADKVAEYRDTALAEATKDIYFDGKQYHWKQQGCWFQGGEREFQVYLRADCNFGDLREKGVAASAIDKATRFVQSRQRVHVATSLVFHPPGIYDIGDLRVLNLYSNRKVIRPCKDPVLWGQEGAMPFLSLYFDTFFLDRDGFQKKHFLKWAQMRYKSALNCEPTKGQVVGIGGEKGIGKNFCDRGIIGGLLGGFTDASSFLMSKTQWNYDLFKVGLWVVDDETALFTQEQREAFQNFLKKYTANSDFRIQKRFCDEIMSKWFGSIMFTFNMDPASVRIVPRCDNTSGDKISLYRASDERVVEFKGEANAKAILDRELPALARYLLDMPEDEDFNREWMTDDRYSLKAFQHPDLLKQAYATSPESILKELLVEVLVRHFSTGEEKDWSLSAVAMSRALSADNSNQFLLRNLTPGAIDRYMANIVREGMLKCSHKTTDNRTNVWVFRREDYAPKK